MQLILGWSFKLAGTNWHNRLVAACWHQSKLSVYELLCQVQARLINVMQVLLGG